MNLIDLFNLPPESAIAYFKSKGYAFSWDWQDIWQEAHAKAFTVAKAMRMDVLQTIRDEVQQALNTGMTLRDFQKDLTPKLQSLGWWGRKMVGDEAGGQEVQLGSPWRLSTIYRTNMQTSYMAGRYADFMENVDDRPYWQYVAVMDSKTRPAHRAMNGLIFAYDDPFWDTHYPPNDWNCRCRVRALSQDNIDERGLRVSTGEGNLSTEQVLVSRTTGEMADVTVYADPRTGAKMAPGAGWNYNPGKAWQDPFIPAPADASYITIGAALSLRTPIDDLPTKTLSTDMLLPSYQDSGWTQNEYMKIFLSEFGATFETPVVFKDVIDDAMVVSDKMFIDRRTGQYKVFKADREQYLKMLAETIKDPTEIWLTEVSGKNGIRLCKRYISIYQDANGKVGGFSIFDLVDGMWESTTSFQTDLQYLDRQRAGMLLYKKKS